MLRPGGWLASWLVIAGCLGTAMASACGGATSSPAADEDASGEGSTGGSSGIGTGSSGAGSSSGIGSSSGVGSSSSGGMSSDASAPIPDATVGDGSSSSGGGNLLDATFDVTPPPTGQAGFAFVVNGAVLTPMSCPAYNWEFPAPASFYQGIEAGPPPPYAVCGQQTPPCPGTTSALIINTGQVPLAYTAEPMWSGTYPPGVQFGDPMELSGVLNPGDRVDIAPVWIGGITAVLGASEPFSDMSHYVSDEGTIPWPAGVAGSNGATTMNVAEINLVNSCHMPAIYW